MQDIREDYGMNGPWVEIHLGTLAENIRRVRGELRPGTDVFFVVKANAYGHGAVPVAERAFQAGVQGFAVAYVREALELRARLPSARILLLGMAQPEDVPLLCEQGITPVVTGVEHARALAAAVGTRKSLPVHLKIDTGMSRLGIPWEAAVEVARAITQLPALAVEGLCTHFATIQPDNPRQAELQFERFAGVRTVVEIVVRRRLFCHVSSSLPYLFKKEWDFDAVRPGILLYGYESVSGTLDRAVTRPILQWKTQAIQVKTVPAGTPVGYGGTFVTERATDIVTLSAGYADGYPRSLSNCGQVLLGGRRRPVAGRVSMNWITVDAGPECGIQAGDEAVLLGEQGGASIWADEIAAQCGTISYEILTGIHASTERRYRG